MSATLQLDLRPRVAMGAALGGTALLLGGLALLSETLSSGDSFLHYLICRKAWSSPELFLDVWGRPVFTAVYAIPALLGLQAVRLWSVVISLVTCWAVYRMAEEEGSGKLQRPTTPGSSVGPLAVIPLLVLQPEYLRASYDGLTELLFACLLAFALWTFRRGQWTTSAILVSLFSMTRWEGCVLMLIWAAFLWPKRRRLSFLVFVPHLSWNLFTAVFYRDWPAVLFPLDMLFRDRTFTPKTYAWDDLLFYPTNSLQILGPALFLAVQLGLLVAGRRRPLLSTALLTMVVFYAVAAWGMPGVRGAAVPMARYFVCLAPLIALVGLEGLKALASAERRSRWVSPLLALVLVEIGIAASLSEHPLRLRNIHLYLVGAGFAAGVLLLCRMAAEASFRRRSLALSLVVLALGSIAVHAAWDVRPFRIGNSESLLREAATWLRRSQPEGGIVLVSEPRFAYYASTPELPGRPFRYEWMNARRAESLPGGEWIAWEWELSSIMFFSMKRAQLDIDPRYQFHRQFGPDRKAVRLYRRRPLESLPPERFTLLTEHYWPDETGSGMSSPPHLGG